MADLTNQIFLKKLATLSALALLFVLAVFSFGEFQFRHQPRAYVSAPMPTDLEKANESKLKGIGVGYCSAGAANSSPGEAFSSSDNQVQNQNTIVKAEAIVKESLWPRYRELVVLTFLTLVTFLVFLFVLIKRFLSEKDLKHQEALLLLEQKVKEKLARQVSHDLRSPLTALNSFLVSQEGLAEQQTHLIKSCLQRITDITNNLVAKNTPTPFIKKGEFTQKNTAKDLEKPELLPLFIESLVSHERSKLRDRIGIELEVNLSHSYGAFVKIPLDDFGKILKGLIQHASLNLPNAKGKVVVDVKKAKNSILVQVSDNGRGMDEITLLQLQNRLSGSFKTSLENPQNKWDHAEAWVIELFGFLKKSAQEIKTWGGSLQVQSYLGVGTTVKVTLPEADVPAWFCQHLTFYNPMQLITLDDDISMHSIYKSRIKSLAAAAQGVEHLVFTSALEFKDFLHTTQNTNFKRRLFLVDYELIGQNTNGLDLIEELKELQGQSILVTSRYDEPRVRKKCLDLNVPVIPKPLIAMVPIRLAAPLKRPDAVLIDDDIQLVHALWQLIADENGKKLDRFKSFHEFNSLLDEYDLRTPIYLDSDLGGSVKGEILAQELFSKGFKNIYLCTGYSKSQFGPMPWIKEIVGKEPPLHWLPAKPNQNLEH